MWHADYLTKSGANVFSYLLAFCTEKGAFSFHYWHAELMPKSIKKLL